MIYGIALIVVMVYTMAKHLHILLCTFNMDLIPKSMSGDSSDFAKALSLAIMRSSDRMS